MDNFPCTDKTCFFVVKNKDGSLCNNARHYHIEEENIIRVVYEIDVKNKMFIDKASIEIKD